MSLSSTHKAIHHLSTQHGITELEERGGGVEENEDGVTDLLQAAAVLVVLHQGSAKEVSWQG